MSTQETSDSPGQTRRAWPVLLLAAPAFVAIWSGWVELGRMTGFGLVAPLPGIADDFQINTAITLPVGVETYAAYAMYVWLGMDVGRLARRFACWSAIGSLILGAGGQVAYHLMVAFEMTHAPWPIVALVACLPVAVLGMGAALAHLVHEGPEHVPTEEDREIAAQLDHYDRMDALRAQNPGMDAEAWTEANIAENLLRERHQAESDAVESDQVSDATPIRPARRPGTAKRGRSNAEKARDLRAKHPQWTNAQIATRVGVSERTVERYFSPAALAKVAQLAPSDQVEATESADGDSRDLAA